MLPPYGGKGLSLGVWMELEASYSMRRSLLCATPPYMVVLEMQRSLRYRLIMVVLEMQRSQLCATALWWYRSIR